MRIAIFGAGAVGGYVGGRLAAAGEDVAFIARGAHLDAMKRDGLRFEGPSGSVQIPNLNVTEDPAEVGPVDLVLFTVKLWDTKKAASQLAPLIAQHTRVVTLQNGIDSVDLIAESVPRRQVLGGAIYILVTMAGPGVLKSPGGNCRIIVEESPGIDTVASFVSACGRTGVIDAKSTDTIKVAIWEKFIGLCAASGVTALMRSTIGPIRTNPETRAFFEQLIDEGLEIARAMEIVLRSDFRKSTIDLIDSVPASYRASMAEDLNRGKSLELSWLSGRMHTLGIRHGIPTPAHSAVYRGLLLHSNGS